MTKSMYEIFPSWGSMAIVTVSITPKKVRVHHVSGDRLLGHSVLGKFLFDKREDAVVALKAALETELDSLRKSIVLVESRLAKVQ